MNLYTKAYPISHRISLSGLLGLKDRIGSYKKIASGSMSVSQIKFRMAYNMKIIPLNNQFFRIWQFL